VILVRPVSHKHKLFIIEDGVAVDGHVTSLLQGNTAFSCERTNWDALVPERLGAAQAHVVVPVVAPRTPKVIGLFEWLRHKPIATPVFAVLPTDAGESVLQLAAETADDFIVSPIRPHELRQRLGRMLAAPRSDLEGLKRRLSEHVGLRELIGTEESFIRIVDDIPRIAAMDLPVLVTGETGTGKELFARAIHHVSKRRNAPFIAVDCGAVPDHLFENELFGHVRGAFTDAHREQRGLIAMAEGGTLFLDEIGSLTPSVQAKLLRFLQDHTYRPLGSDRYQRANINVIAAMNRDLHDMVRDKEFRADLYYRLNVLRAHLPPLRERRGDIALLATHFLEERRALLHAPRRSFSRAALRAMELYDWPGNVRELANVVDRALVASEAAQILPSHLDLSTAKGLDKPARDFRYARAAVVAAFVRGYLEDLLQKHLGNVTHAAREAHKERRAFGRLLKKYAIGRAAG
jgi:DNA-binding NtrC family response regulator